MFSNYALKIENCVPSTPQTSLLQTKNKNHPTHPFIYRRKEKEGLANCKPTLNAFFCLITIFFLDTKPPLPSNNHLPYGQSPVFVIVTVPSAAIDGACLQRRVVSLPSQSPSWSNWREAVI